jgi:S1-C subfamily serine protease
MEPTAAPDTQASNEIYVLKRGQILGPFTMEDLRAGLASGAFLPRDFVQQGGLPIWQPLSRFLDAPSLVQGVVAPDWKCVLSWMWVRLRQDVGAGSFLIGLLGALLGTIIVLLAHWPFALALPFFLIPIAAALAAMKQGQPFVGLALLLVVAAIPVGFSFLPKTAPAPAPVAAVAPLKPAPPVAAPVVAANPAPPAPEKEYNPAVVPPVEAEPAPKSPAARIAEPLPPPSAAKPAPAPSTVPITALASTTPAEPLPKNLPPLPAPSASAPAEPGPAPDFGDLVQHYSGALILVKATEGSGSGFVCKAADGQVRLLTNIHVVAGMKQPQFTALNGTRLNVANPEAAVGRDIFRTTINAPPAAALDLVTDLESTVKIGDDVVVLGNSGGGGVVTKLEGKLVGIGPDRVEVSAEFIPGNSGSPIVHVPSGKVIGIATYLTKRYEEFAGKGANPSGDSTIRRFGFRVDKVAQWQPVNWAAFQGEAEQIRRIEQLTGDVFDFLGSLRKKSRSDFATDTLRRPAMQWLSVVNKPHVSPSDRLAATRGFLGSLRAMVRGDVYAADGQLRYDYFRNELSQQREIRDRLYEAFDDDVKRLSSTAGRIGY